MDGTLKVTNAYVCTHSLKVSKDKKIIYKLNSYGLGTVSDYYCH